MATGHHDRFHHRRTGRLALNAANRTDGAARMDVERHYAIPPVAPADAEPAAPASYDRWPGDNAFGADPVPVGSGAGAFCCSERAAARSSGVIISFMIALISSTCWFTTFGSAGSISPFWTP